MRQCPGNTRALLRTASEHSQRGDAVVHLECFLKPAGIACEILPETGFSEVAWQSLAVFSPSPRRGESSESAGVSGLLWFNFRAPVREALVLSVRTYSQRRAAE